MVTIGLQENGAASAWVLSPELQEIMDDDADLVRELASMYLSDSPQRLQKIDDAIRSSDFALIRPQAHSLKGSSLQMGAMRLATLFAELESSENPGADECASMMREIDREFALIRFEMDAFVANHMGHPVRGSAGVAQ